MSDEPEDDVPPEYENNEAQPDFDGSPDAWQRYNVTWTQIRSLRIRAEDVLYGRTKALLCYGPPGVGKSHGVMLDARQYAANRKRLWEQMELDDPYRERFTRVVEGIEEFQVPFVRCHGRITPVMLYALFCRFSAAGMAVICDDVRSLMDTMAQNLIQDATDKEGDYKISWETSRGDIIASMDGQTFAYPTQAQFLAGLIILNNFAPNSAKASLIFDPALRNRCAEVSLTWDKQDIGLYIDRMAFTNKKSQGLWKYLAGPTYGPVHLRGLGFAGLDGEAIDILKDVRSFYHQYFRRIEVVGFRFLQRVLEDRVHHRDIWRTLALDHLLKEG